MELRTFLFFTHQRPSEALLYLQPRAYPVFIQKGRGAK